MLCKEMTDEAIEKEKTQHPEQFLAYLYQKKGVGRTMPKTTNDVTTETTSTQESNKTGPVPISPSGTLLGGIWKI